jgi:hypothetical protein
MNGTPDEALDLERLKARIREQAARKRAEVAAVIPLAVRSPDGRTFNWLEAKALLRTAATFAEAGTPPPLEGMRGPKRWLAAQLARVVRRLTRFITTRQTDYNVSLLDTVRDLAESLHETETRLLQQQVQIRQLEALVGQLQLRGPAPAAERRPRLAAAGEPGACARPLPLPRPDRSP